MLTLHEVAEALFAVRQGDNTGFTRVVTDSRAIRAGDLFVALKGERFDAHDFVADVLARGAAGAVVRCDFDLPGAPLVKVADPRLALGQLAALWRRRFDLPLAGITGSNGKTTVKEMLRSMLAQWLGDEAVLATGGNLNNDIGMPLTLLGLRDTHRAAVIEMGMNHAGELTYLSGLARPTVALVNNALRAHIGHFGSVEAIARAKAEIFAGLAADGVAVINRDDPNRDLFVAAAAGRQIVEFGLATGDVHALDTELLADGSRLTLVTPAGRAAVMLPVPGQHMLANALAACAVASAMGVPLPAMVAGLQAFAGVPGRLAFRRAASGLTVIDDTYNANPDSVRAAIAVLAARSGRRWLVFGDLGELGEGAPALHAEIGQAAKAAGLDGLVTLGTVSREAAAAFGPGALACDSVEAVLEALAPLGAADSVLVKGSRFMKMERVVAALTATATGGH